MDKGPKLIGTETKQIYCDEFIADQNDHPATVSFEEVWAELKKEFPEVIGEAERLAKEMEENHELPVE